MEWEQLLSGTPARAYICQETPYEEQVRRAAALLNQADAVLIGAGAGLSTAAGLVYGGRRFTENFGEFIERYGPGAMRDMYTAGFYAFPTEEERWGYWSKHSYVNRIEPSALPLYRQVFGLASGREHFVLTTNVDHQFWKAGFEDKDIFAPQGDYGLIQCANACHQKTYDATGLFLRMGQAREGCRIPSAMAPKCPACGGPMVMNLRCGRYFVEDGHWRQAAKRYGDFLKKAKGRRLALLELGVGFNTPAIIRFPFEKMTAENREWSLIRLNLDEPAVPENLGSRAVGIDMDLAVCIGDLKAAMAEGRGCTG